MESRTIRELRELNRRFRSVGAALRSKVTSVFTFRRKLITTSGGNYAMCSGQLLGSVSGRPQDLYWWAIIGSHLVVGNSASKGAFQGPTLPNLERDLKRRRGAQRKPGKAMHGSDLWTNADFSNQQLD
ncbi:hypothetical protein J6590_055720 [Homalodisca vitripennis]|nr:hypothetical protein J6590_055720 [Homalodisca vitripennis]